MDYQARRRARDLRLGDDELIVARRELDDLRDAVYVLACAVEDVDRDLAEAADPVEVRSALDWLLAAARPLAERRYSPLRNVEAKLHWRVPSWAVWGATSRVGRRCRRSAAAGRASTD